MKTFTNAVELKALNACADGYKTFIETHGDNDAKLSQYLESNGWADTWWLIEGTYDQFSDSQKKDLRLLGCEYALSCIDNFEKEFPEDKRPRLDIEASIKFANGEIDEAELEAARASAWSARAAVRAAAQVAERAPWAEVRSAALSVLSAAGPAAKSAAESKNKQMLIDLFLKWELEAGEG